MRYALMILAVLVTTECFPQAHVSVKNDCPGAWFRVSWLMGAGREGVHPRLDLGERIVIALTGVAAQSNQFVIMADGFRERDDYPLGSAERYLYVDPVPGEPTAPKNNWSWGISYLYPGGCPDLFQVFQE